MGSTQHTTRQRRRPPKVLKAGVSKRAAHAAVTNTVRSSKTPKAAILKHGHSYIALVSFK